MNVFVGLSGGVDSSVTAAQLQKEKRAIRGVFLKGWYPENIPCTWKEDRQDAMRVAAHLGIPFSTLDLTKEYKESVIDYLINEYKEGRTPNPDVLCNRDIKFGAFLNWAKANGADKVATGHYARVEEKDGFFRLYKGKDLKKDQSYFLYALTQNELAHILFPLGDIEDKSKTRTLAKKYSLPVAEKRDSQGLCFIGHVDIESFLREYIPITKGKVLTVDGKEVGEHEGVEVYTLGQRHGFSAKDNEPTYVLAKDLESNTIVVGSKKEQEDRAPHELTITNMTWTYSFPEGEGITAQYRYHGPEIPVTSLTEEGKVAFAEKLSEIPAAGQILVFYRGEECLGGGTIVY